MGKNKRKLKKTDSHINSKQIKFKLKKNISVNKVDTASPPVKAEDFSKNWKIFLENQKKLNENEIPLKQKQNRYTGIIKKDKKSNQKLQKNLNLKSKWNKEKKQKETACINHEIWFDDVDPVLLEKECGIKQIQTLKDKALKAEKTEKDGEVENKDETNEVTMTRYIGLDCEMVGVGIDGKENALARVSLVNSMGQCIYDKYVKTAEKVGDYRTEVSGIRASDLVTAPDYATVQKEVADILKGRVLVGHALQNDLKVLMLSHSRREIRDTSKYKPFKKLMKTKRPALRKLVAKILHETIQSGEHSSVVDARATMKLYQIHKKEWEKSLRVKRKDVNVEQQIVFMGKEVANKRNVNKWTKIRRRRKSKQ